MKKYLSDYLFLFLIAGTVIVLDQLTKTWIRQNLALGEVLRPDLWISNYARIIYWKNTGAAFGMFQNLGGVFSIFSMVVSVIIVYYFPQIPIQDWLIRVAMGLLLGGAVGNLISRLNQGFVTDFLSIGSFPVFNIADASISVGVVTLFFGMWMQERNKKKETSHGDEGGYEGLAEPPAISEDIQSE